MAKDARLASKKKAMFTNFILADPLTTMRLGATGGKGRASC